LFADGGLMASKPYAAISAHINNMSNYCGSLRYKPTVKSGPKSCPFRYPYWNFIDRNAARLSATRAALGRVQRTLARKATLNRFQPPMHRLDALTGPSVLDFYEKIPPFAADRYTLIETVKLNGVDPKVWLT